VTARYSEIWDTTNVPLTTIAFEVKAGTTGVQPVAPGTVAFDNFVAAIPSSSETVLFTEDFQGASLDTTKWAVSVLSGSQDTSVAVTQAGGSLQIGPLKQNTSGSHYNGILSVSTIDLTGAYASVQAVATPASATTADSMLTLPLDGSNHYRIYVESGVLNCEKKIAAVKTLTGSVSFNAAMHAYWRIRHNAATDQIVCEAAPDSGGAPGSWTAFGTFARELAVTAVRIELKAGTSQAEANAAGTPSFDNVRVARPQ
jgi:hypothetical protein